MAERVSEEELRTLARSPQNECFACGPGNPGGLQLQFERDGDTVRSRFIPSRGHCGWAGIVHGGILSTALDEAMSYVLYFEGIKAYTARMDVRFRAPVKQGDDLTVEAQKVRQARRVVDIEGRLLRAGEVVAESSSRFMMLGQLQPADLIASDVDVNG